MSVGERFFSDVMNNMIVINMENSIVYKYKGCKIFEYFTETKCLYFYNIIEGNYKLGADIYMNIRKILDSYNFYKGFPIFVDNRMKLFK